MAGRGFKSFQELLASIKDDDEDLEALNDLPALKKSLENYAGRGMKPSATNKGITNGFLHPKTETHVNKYLKPPINGFKEDNRTSEIDNEPQKNVPAPKADNHKRVGNAVGVTTNYIKLHKISDHGIYQYCVKFDPPIDHRGISSKIIRQHTDQIGDIYLFDGSTLYTPKKLAKKISIVSKHCFNDSKVSIDIVFIKEKPHCELIHLYNVLLNKIMHELQYLRLRDTFFDNTRPQHIPQQKMQIWPGYVMNITEVEDGLMLNLDPHHRILRTNTVYSEIEHFLNQNNQHLAKKRVMGVVVMTTYNQKTYTIQDVDFNLTPMSTFKRKDEDITYVDYYKQQYNIDIMKFKQPLLLSRLPAKGKTEGRLVHLIPELCLLTGLSESEKNNQQLMKDVATFTRLTPNQRWQSMRKFIKNVNDSPKAVEILKNWGLALASDLLSLDAWIVPTENIVFGKGGSKGALLPKKGADWSIETMTNPVLIPVDIENWIVIYTHRDNKNVKSMINCMKQASVNMGIEFKQPRLILLKSEQTEEYIDALRKHTQNMQIVMCVCPSERDDRYTAIKKICCVEEPIPSQVVNGYTISKPARLQMIASKILLQMNCKLGGSLWTVRIPYERLMVVGMDVFHSKVSSVQSVCGFVASYDQTVSKWYNRVCFQSNGQEIIDQIKMCFVDALQHYYKHNNFYPQRIIIYRDGVGDGQFKLIKDYELKQLLSAFTIISSDYKPELVFIVVQKRINTRIFMSDKSQIVNPVPGTIVDHTIRKKFMYNFYVVSVKSAMSAVIPSNYIVLYDSANIPPAEIQRFTFKMCHLYYNWSGTIRVPAPCQYAHKLAFLVGNHLRKEPSVVLRDRLFHL